MSNAALATELEEIRQSLASAAKPSALGEPPKVGGRPDMRTDDARLRAGVQTAQARLGAIAARLNGRG
jgi:hypothetical protein